MITVNITVDVTSDLPYKVSHFVYVLSFKTYEEAEAFTFLLDLDENQLQVMREGVKVPHMPYDEASRKMYRIIRDKLKVSNPDTDNYDLHLVANEDLHEATQLVRKLFLAYPTNISKDSGEKFIVIRKRIKSEYKLYFKEVKTMTYVGDRYGEVKGVIFYKKRYRTNNDYELEIHPYNNSMQHAILDYILYKYVKDDNERNQIHLKLFKNQTTPDALIQEAFKRFEIYHSIHEGVKELFDGRE